MRLIELANLPSVRVDALALSEGRRDATLPRHEGRIQETELRVSSPLSSHAALVLALQAFTMQRRDTEAIAGRVESQNPLVLQKPALHHDDLA